MTSSGTGRPTPPAPDSLFVAYYASAESAATWRSAGRCRRAILDLYAEFRLARTACRRRCGRGLLGALAALRARRHGRRREGRDAPAGPRAAARGRRPSAGRSWTTASRTSTPWPACCRGCCRRSPSGRATSSAPCCGAATWPPPRGWSTPASRSHCRTLERLRRHWGAIKEHLIAEVDQDFGVYDGTSFRPAASPSTSPARASPGRAPRPAAWPSTTTPSASWRKAYPQMAPLRELRHALGELRLNDLAVGQDGRNRTLLSPFGARTGRNTPSNTKFIFGPAVWLRGLIRPEPGRALAYIDWTQQEIGIAAALSRRPGDDRGGPVRRPLPRLRHAGEAGAGGRDQGDPRPGPGRVQGLRARRRTTAWGRDALAGRIGCTLIEARELLELHRRTYPTFWRWSDAAVDHAMLHGSIETVFGWRLHVGADANPRSLRNFPMQANGAEMLRLACCLATERGVQVCRPGARRAADRGGRGPGSRTPSRPPARRWPRRAGRCSAGFELATEAKVIRWPDRYSDPRGEVMWQRVMAILDRLEAEPRPPRISRRRPMIPIRITIPGVLQGKASLDFRGSSGAPTPRPGLRITRPCCPGMPAR